MQQLPRSGLLNRQGRRFPKAASSSAAFAGVPLHGSALQPTIPLLLGATSARPLNRSRGRPCPPSTAVAVLATIAVPQHAERFRFRGQHKSLLDVSVWQSGDNISVLVSADISPGSFSHAPQLEWAMYRASPSRRYMPPEAQPPGSAVDPSSGEMRTNMQPMDRPSPSASKQPLYTTTFNLPKKLAPLQLAMRLIHPREHDDRKTVEKPVDGGHPYFFVPLGALAGGPSPLGPTVLARGTDGRGEPTYAVNFAVYSTAPSMSLCLVRAGPPTDNGGNGGGAPSTSGAPLQGSTYLQVALNPQTNKTGGVWHIALSGLKNLDSLCFAWKPDTEGSGEAKYAPLMLDPRAPAAVAVALPESAYKEGPLPSRAQTAPRWLGLLGPLLQPFDWTGSKRPRRALEDMVACEVDVQAFTSSPAAEAAGVKPEHRGTWLGVLDRLHELKSAGINTLVLSSALLSAPSASSRQHAAPLSYFAPTQRHTVGSSALDAGRQLKELVKQLHLQGFEVLLQLEFCFTGEPLSSPSAPRDSPAAAAMALESVPASMRGLAPGTYYRAAAPNVLNAGHAVVRELICDALTHWSMHYQVDGFVLLAADNLVIDRGGTVQDSPAIVEAIAHHPLLKDLKVVAHSPGGNLLPRGGARGFPHYGQLMEWNTRFTNDAQRLLASPTPGTGVTSALATRITGSADLFAACWDQGYPGGLAAGRRPAFSLNCPTPQGDVPPAAVLPGYGAPPGPGSVVDTPAAKSMLMLALLSNGIPLLPSSAFSAPGIPQFVRVVHALRQKYRTLLTPPWFTSPRDISWHGISPASEPDWAGAGAYIAFKVTNKEGQAVMVAINGEAGPVTAALPAPPAGRVWRCALTTAPLDSSAIGAPIEGELLLEGVGMAAQPANTIVLSPKAAVFLEVDDNPWQQAHQLI